MHPNSTPKVKTQSTVLFNNWSQSHTSTASAPQTSTPTPTQTNAPQQTTPLLNSPVSHTQGHSARPTRTTPVSHWKRVHLATWPDQETAGSLLLLLSSSYGCSDLWSQGWRTRTGSLALWPGWCCPGAWTARFVLQKIHLSGVEGRCWGCARWWLTCRWWGRGWGCCLRGRFWRTGRCRWQGWRGKGWFCWWCRWRWGIRRSCWVWRWRQFGLRFRCRRGSWCTGWVACSAWVLLRSRCWCRRFIRRGGTWVARTCLLRTFWCKARCKCWS